jgi:hypothetical protein
MVNLRAGVAEVVYHKALKSDQALGMATGEEGQEGQDSKGSANAGKADGKQAPPKETGPAAEKEGSTSATTGKIVNLMSGDAEKIGMIGLALPNTLINLPLIAVIMCGIYDPIGPRHVVLVCNRLCCVLQQVVLCCNRLCGVSTGCAVLQQVLHLRFDRPGGVCGASGLDDVRAYNGRGHEAGACFVFIAHSRTG